jgi:CIC family chloride channel protein
MTVVRDLVSPERRDFLWNLSRFGAALLCVALGASAFAIVFRKLPQVTGNGYEAIDLILAGQIGLGLILVLLFGKALATTASVSSGSPGSVFTPSLFLGAALGGAFGHFRAHVDAAAVDAVQGYSLIGMAAMIAETTHAPVMAAAMVFELSGDYAIVLPLLVATGTATLLSKRLRPDSVYGEELRRKGMAWDLTIEGRRIRPSGNEAKLPPP